MFLESYLQKLFVKQSLLIKLHTAEMRTLSRKFVGVKLCETAEYCCLGLQMLSYLVLLFTLKNHRAFSESRLLWFTSQALQLSIVH